MIDLTQDEKNRLSGDIGMAFDVLTAVSEAVAKRIFRPEVYENDPVHCRTKAMGALIASHFGKNKNALIDVATEMFDWADSGHVARLIEDVRHGETPVRLSNLEKLADRYRQVAHDYKVKRLTSVDSRREAHELSALLPYEEHSMHLANAIEAALRLIIDGSSSLLVRGPDKE